MSAHGYLILLFTHPINNIVYELLPSTSAPDIIVNTDVLEYILWTPIGAHQ